MSALIQSPGGKSRMLWSFLDTTAHRIHIDGIGLYQCPISIHRHGPVLLFFSFFRVCNRRMEGLHWGHAQITKSRRRERQELSRFYLGEMGTNNGRTGLDGNADDFWYESIITNRLFLSCAEMKYHQIEKKGDIKEKSQETTNVGTREGSDTSHREKRKKKKKMNKKLLNRLLLL